MSCPVFIAESFAVRTSAHFLHLSSQSYAQHVALAEFYDGMLDKVDAFAEVTQGANGRITKYPSITPDDTDDPVEQLEEYLDTITAEERVCKNSQALLNILAELEQLTKNTLYKLKFLK